jgi:hypothetical protein
MEFVISASTGGSIEPDAPGQPIPKFRKDIYLAGFIVAVASILIITALVLRSLFGRDKTRKRLALLMIILIVALSFSIATLAQVGISHHPDDINSAMSKTESLAVLGVGIFAALALTSTWRSCFQDKRANWTVNITHTNKVIFFIIVIGWLATWWITSAFDWTQDEFSVARAVAIYSAFIITLIAFIYFIRFLLQLFLHDDSVRQASKIFKLLMFVETMCLLIAVLWSLAGVSIDIRTRYATNFQASRFILAMFVGPLAFIIYTKTTDTADLSKESVPSAVEYDTVSMVQGETMPLT